MKPNILVIAALRPEKMKVLEQNYTLHRFDLAPEPDTMLDNLSEKITAVVTSGGKGLKQDVIAKLPDLKIVASSGVGYDSIDVDACTARGILVTNTPDVLTDDVADVALMLLLATQRRLIPADAYLRSGDWGKKGMFPLTSSLAGKKVGIVGLGRIGLAIARRIESFRTEIFYMGRKQKRDIAYPYFASLLELAKASDIVIVATSGGADTKQLISAEVIAAIGPQGSLINISRGSVVDESALIAALQSKKLGAAGLDVYLNEPNPNPAFAALENTVLYPHHASGTVETRAAMSQLVLDNLAAHFDGATPITPVNAHQISQG